MLLEDRMASRLTDTIGPCRIDSRDGVRRLTESGEEVRARDLLWQMPGELVLECFRRDGREVIDWRGARCAQSVDDAEAHERGGAHPGVVRTADEVTFPRIDA